MILHLTSYKAGALGVNSTDSWEMSKDRLFISLFKYTSPPPTEFLNILIKAIFFFIVIIWLYYSNISKRNDKNSIVDD